MQRRSFITKVRSLGMLVLAVGILQGCGDILGKTSEEHLQHGKDYESKGDYRAALVEYKSALQQTPSNMEARLLLGQLYVKLGQGIEAEKEIRQAENLGIKRESLLVSLGDALLLSGKYREALDQIQPMPGLSPRLQAQVLRVRADAQFALRQFRDACNSYAESAALDADSAPAQWGLANCSALDNNFAAAQSRMEALIRKQPDNALSYFQQGDILRQFGHFQEAEQAYSGAIKLDPKLVMAYVNRAGTRLAQNNETSAQADIKEAAQIDPKSPHVRYMQALLDYRHGRYEAARDKLQPILNRMYWNFPTILLFGQVAYQLGSYTTAEGHLSRLLQVAPQDPMLLRLVSASQLKQGDAKKALATLAPLLRADQEDPQVLALAGEIHMALGDLNQARANHERALAQAPQAAPVRMALARINLAQGEHAKATDDLRQLAALDNKWTEADTLLIELKLRQRAYDQALSEIAALPESKRSNNPIVENLLGTAYTGQKNYTQAKAHYKRALELKPDFIPAASNLVYLELKDKRVDAARAVFKGILDRSPNHLEAMLGMASIEAAVGQTREQLAWLEKAAKAHPKAIQPRKKLLAHYLSTGQHARALPLAKELQSLSPNQPDILALLARAQFAGGDHTGAVSTLTRATTLKPDAASLWVALANAQMAVGNKKAARISLQRSLKSQPNNLDARAGLVGLDLADGKRDAALAKAREIQGTHPKSSAGFILAGDILTLEGRFSEAAKDYERAYQIKPSAPLVVSWFKALRGAGQPGPAMAKLSDWLKQHPTDHLVRLHLAAVYRDSAKPADALPHYQYLLKLNPDNALVLNEMALAHRRMGSKQALEFAEKAYKLNPVPGIADTLGVILLDRGEARRALEVLEKAVAGGTQNPEIRYHYALALARNDRNDKARKELEQLLSGGRFAQEQEARALLGQL
jgi:putative PEP-CTERM system TPR-repeat lipoprotein